MNKMVISAHYVMFNTPEEEMSFFPCLNALDLEKWVFKRELQLLNPATIAKYASDLRMMVNMRMVVL